MGGISITIAKSVAEEEMMTCQLRGEDRDSKAR